MRKMPWEEGFNPDDENAGDDGAPDPGAVSTGAMARLAELPAESDALSAGNTKTLDRVGDTSFPEADELAPKPPPRAPMSAPAPELPPVTPRPAFLDGAPGLDEAPHVAKPLAASPEEYANETAPLGNSPKLTGDLSLKSQRVLGPKDLDQVGRPPPGPIDAPEDPIASGAKRDRMNQLMRAIELGGKQANAGLGGGPVGALVTEKSDFEDDARKEAATAATKAQAKAIDDRNFAEKQAEEKRRIIEADRRARRDDKKDTADGDYRDRRLAQDVVHDKATEDLAAASLGLKQKAADKGKTIPAETVTNLAGLGEAETQLDDLAATFKRLGMGSTGAKIGSLATNALGLQGTDSAEFNASALRTMQAVGTILEGGKLAAGDEQKYRRMLPQAGDSDAVVRQKIDGLKSFLRSTAAGRVSGLDRAGYDAPSGLLDGAKPKSTQAPAPRGKVHVSNGKEAFWVDAADVEAARHDGFEVVR